MKTPTESLRPFEFWLLENIFQKWSDMTYRRLRLTNFFWASCCFLVSCFAFLWTAYKGIFFDHDPLMILAMVVMVAAFLVPSLRMIKKAWFLGYDDAIYGVENSLKNEHSRLRAESLLFTFMVTALWALIAFKKNDPHIEMLILWVSMMQYPTFAFCSCNPPGCRLK